MVAKQEKVVLIHLLSYVESDGYGFFADRLSSASGKVAPRVGTLVGTTFENDNEDISRQINVVVSLLHFSRLISNFENYERCSIRKGQDGIFDKSLWKTKRKNTKKSMPNWRH